MNSDQRLSHLADGKRILGVEGTLVPAAPTAEHQGNHLFVNCLYHHDVIKMTPEAILSLAREDTILVLKSLVAQSMLHDAASVCISFVAKDAAADYPCRLYRYSILTSYVSHDASAINEACFAPDKHCLQGSHHEGITKLLAGNQ